MYLFLIIDMKWLIFIIIYNVFYFYKNIIILNLSIFIIFIIIINEMFSEFNIVYFIINYWLILYLWFSFKMLKNSRPNYFLIMKKYIKFMRLIELDFLILLVSLFIIGIIQLLLIPVSFSFVNIATYFTFTSNFYITFKNNLIRPYTIHNISISRSARRNQEFGMSSNANSTKSFVLEIANIFISLKYFVYNFNFLLLKYNKHPV